jgi:hypothetical protein
MHRALFITLAPTGRGWSAGPGEGVVPQVGYGQINPMNPLTLPAFGWAPPSPRWGEGASR